MERRIEEVRSPLPLPPKIFCIIGTITIRAKKPKIIDGRPDNSSTKVSIAFSILFGAKKDRYIEHNPPKGRAIITERSVTQMEATIIEAIP